MGTFVFFIFDTTDLSLALVQTNPNASKTALDDVYNHTSTLQRVLEKLCCLDAAFGLESVFNFGNDFGTLTGRAGEKMPENARRLAQQYGQHRSDERLVGIPTWPIVRLDANMVSFHILVVIDVNLNISDRRQ